jgi:mannose-1-phosphate guanylyltransferase/phosphomannomutase
MIQAVVMAGGEGTRLRPLTSNLPKPMVPVGNRPIMGHILGLLRRLGVKQAFATIHYLADEIEAYFGDGSDFGLELRYSVEDIPLGTAGSVERVARELAGTFLIISGDALTDFDLGPALEFHRERKAAATIVLARVAHPQEFGVVITAPDGRVVRFLEKPSPGEVFSDTINTGIYLLEPEVLGHLETGRPADFSRDLFPLLLKQEEALYGYAAEGYWCDIGNLQQYQEANYHFLEGRIRLEPGAPLRAEGVWVGENSEISPGARLLPPVLVGRNCTIAPGVEVGPYTVIGDNCVIEEGSRIQRAVVWENSYLGRACQVFAATICRNVVAKGNVTIEEGAVIGDRCLLEEGTIVQPQIRLWPNKITEPGSRVTMSLVWGTKWPGSLFSGVGVSGLANVEITPDFAVRLGAAFGAYLEAGAQVVTGRDSHNVSRMLKRAFIAGLMSVGANIMDVRTMPGPVVRHMALMAGAAGGMNVSLSAQDPDLVQIELFDHEGKNLDRAAERKIEGIFFREDFRRCHREGVGTLEFLSRTIEYYTEEFLNFVDAEAIRRAAARIVVDYAHGPLCLILPVLLGRLGCDTIGVNAYVDPTKERVVWARRQQEVGQLRDVVLALKADLGVVLGAHGERFALLDEQGEPLLGDELLACMVRLVAGRSPPEATIVIPVNASQAVEEVCRKAGHNCLRAKANPRALMEACREPGLVLAGDCQGGFIFPQFLPAFDATASLGKLLELLAVSALPLSQVRALLPPVHKAERSLPCPWERKGAVMRRLHEESRDQRLDQTDGLKIYLDGGWVLVVPDVSAPLLHLFAEAGSDEEAEQLVDRYSDRIWAIQEEV